MPFQVSFPDMERELQQGLGNPFPTDAGIVLGNWSLRVGASGSIVGTTEAKEIKTTKHAGRDAKHLSPKMKDSRGLELHLLSNGALVRALAACLPKAQSRARPHAWSLCACRMLGLARDCVFFRARACLAVSARIVHVMRVTRMHTQATLCGSRPYESAMWLL